jgi:hypothetical protein
MKSELRRAISNLASWTGRSSILAQIVFGERLLFATNTHTFVRGISDILSPVQILDFTYLFFEVLGNVTPI